MREEIRKIQELMEAAEYVTEAPVATSVHLAMRLRKPLLIEGHAGVGKTEIAKVMARMLGTNLIRLQCYEGLDAGTALYEWNYQKQLLHIKLHETSGRSAKEEEREIFSEEFLLRRPLLQAITQHDQSPVLLVDEVAGRRRLRFNLTRVIHHQPLRDPVDPAVEAHVTGHGPRVTGSTQFRQSRHSI